MTWLVTGGLGYIGSHVVAGLLNAGERVVILDDLSTGLLERLPAHVPLIRSSVADHASVRQALHDHQATGVIHTAGKKRVDESLADPLKYYAENVDTLRSLLHSMSDSHVRSFLFSSSAAVYGDVTTHLVDESHPLFPTSPYGFTKLIGERMLSDYASAHGLAVASLRYFNVAGCSSQSTADTLATNLIPMVLNKLASGEAPTIYGEDYPTPDGTCIRDFVHVADVASAHVRVAQALAEQKLQGLVANVGRGEGFSVRHVIEEARKITGTAGHDWSRPVTSPRRPGDAPRVVGSCRRLAHAVGWRAQFDLRSMITSTWDARVKASAEDDVV